MPDHGRSVEQILAVTGVATIAWAAFDPDWYLAKHPDVRRQLPDDAAETVLRYYLRHGQALGHSPNIWFDEAWHLRAYPVVAAAVQAGRVASAFDAYCREGYHGRAPHWLFDELGYRLRNADLTEECLMSEGLANGYDHYLTSGDRAGCISNDFFDPSSYLAYLSPEDAQRASQIGLFTHFLIGLETGRSEHRTSLYFDPIWYRKAYAEQMRDQRSTLRHYLRTDTPSDFNPILEFSEAHYLRANPDVAASVTAGRFRNGYEHFLRSGAREHRAPNQDADLRSYASTQPVAAWLADDP